MSELVESPEERKARYRRLAIAAAAAAARVPTAQARSAYLILAETWSALAKADDSQEPGGVAPKEETATQEIPQEPDGGPTLKK